ncbi:transporter substrate-binding domain-containing protein [Methanoplanus endosymbiosus]|uniref:Transporter substrate-binding domain-containing protein n=1 Tax=Methanoplanus endosymbiosus TaxID=33865 RepID=A0A9E7PN33_9EURY|nr:transporter substrate-binding domain-containing protein [Methanoplanus endosymbiosus]UUX93303.1 transporter substrate-binding domain-containing protein [Methanoplanus endosymbiosus]
MLILLTAFAGCTTETDVNGGDQMSTVTYYTEEYPPWNYEENGKARGISVDLLTEAALLSGIVIKNDDITVMSWSDAYNNTLNNEDSAIFATVKLPEREDKFRWAGPIGTEKMVVFSKRSSGIVIEDEKDLKGYRIEVVKDDAAAGELMEAGYESKSLVVAGSPEEMINSVISGDADLFCYGEEAAKYYSAEITGSYNFFEEVYTLNGSELYYAFSRDTPDEYIDKIQSGIESIKEKKGQSGQTGYDRILSEYLASKGLSGYSYLTEEFAPMNYMQDGELKGISAELLEIIFDRLDVEKTAGDIEVMDWPDAYQKTLNEENTVLFTMAKTPEREDLFRWAGPIMSNTNALFAKKESNIEINNAEDLVKYKIGVVKETASFSLLKEAGYPEEKITGADSPEDALNMLDSGDIDLWSTGRIAGAYYIAELSGSPESYLTAYEFEPYEFYYAFNRETPERIVEAFQRTLENIIADRKEKGYSEYDEVIYRYAGAMHTSSPYSEGDVTELVKLTAGDIKTDAKGTIEKINLGEAPYKDKTHPNLYIFVFSGDGTVTANAESIAPVGTNLLDKGDITGKMFRNDIIKTATDDGSGWTEYIYVKPDTGGLYYKKSYSESVTGSDGDTYIVGAGIYT